VRSNDSPRIGLGGTIEAAGQGVVVEVSRPRVGAEAAASVEDEDQHVRLDQRDQGPEPEADEAQRRRLMQDVEWSHELDGRGREPDDDGEPQCWRVQPRRPRVRDRSIDQGVADAEGDQARQDDDQCLDDAGERFEFLPHRDDLRVLGPWVETGVPAG
jgi:hypothetical protein